MNWLASIAELGHGAALLGAAEQSRLSSTSCSRPTVGARCSSGGPRSASARSSCTSASSPTALGRFDAAATHLDAAAAWASAVGARPWEVWTQVHRAELAAGDDAGARRRRGDRRALGLGRAAARARALAPEAGP